MGIDSMGIEMGDLRGSVAEVRLRGKDLLVPAATVDGTTVVVLDKWLKIATVKDEMFLDRDVVGDPERFVRRLKAQGLKAHVFAFSQQLPDITPRYGYCLDWDNLAVVATDKGDAVWEAGLPQVTRKNIRRAHRRGVVVKAVELDDAFVRGVTEIYNESPLRQGKPFYHYGKDFETIKREVSTFPDSSEFIGAYHGDELIGFIKLVHLGPVASIMHIVSKNAHFDKRPTNALLAEAVRHCSRKGSSYLVYGNYTYGRKTDSSLATFKRHNGFEKVMIPRYYIPLTFMGRMIVTCKLHRGVIGILPQSLTSALLAVRARMLGTMVALRGSRAHRQGQDGENES